MRIRTAICILVATVSVAIFAASELSAVRRAQTELREIRGLRVGATRTEVRYALGEPQQVYGVEDFSATEGMASFQPVYFIDVTEDPSDGVNALPEGKTADDFDDWAYVAVTGETVEIHFERGQVASVRCLDFDRLGRCGPVLGIRSGMHEAEVLKRVGQPTSENLDENGVKTIVYSDLGLEMLLQRQEVYGIKLQLKAHHQLPRRAMEAALLRRPS